jgi:hypothetical protein
MQETTPKPRRGPEKPDSPPPGPPEHPRNPPAPRYSGSEDDTPTQPLPVISPAVEDALRAHHTLNLLSGRPVQR